MESVSARRGRLVSSTPAGASGTSMPTPTSTGPQYVVLCLIFMQEIPIFDPLMLAGGHS